MKTVWVGICSIFFLSCLLFVFKRMLRQARRKSSLYLHSSELEPTPIAMLAPPVEPDEKDSGITWGVQD